jgi:endonuclease YncB( thermonuclease family)
MRHVFRLLASFLTCVAVMPLDANHVQADDDVLWTQHPVHIDRSKQNYERLPAVQHEIDTRLWVNVPDRIKVLDSASFSFDSKTYRIGKVHPVAMKRTCKDVVAGRWGCGRMAAIFLGNLVRGKRLLCDVKPGDKETVLNHCQLGTRDLAAAIISSGFGRAEDSDALAKTEELARSKKAGLWRNADCSVDFDSC